MMTLRLIRRSNVDNCLSVTVVVEKFLATSSATNGTHAAARAKIIRRFKSDVAVAARITPAVSSINTTRTSIPSTSIPNDITMANQNIDLTKLPEKNKQEMDSFKFQDYDCIGFDLDNTICRYKVCNMVKMEYEALSQYLITEHSYSTKYLSQPIEENVDFMIKGLILDVKKGNLLRIAPNGRILHGSHGTKELSQQELIDYYGDEMRWDVTDVFIKDPLHTWNGPLSETMRTLSDYFDMPASLVFARAVDTLDEENGARLEEYNIYSHIVEALQNMFQREHFGSSKGGYFPKIKDDPDNYIHKCSDDLMKWFADLKKANKLLFLITGSNVDFASHTATKSLGENWQDIFDIVICFAKKPGFFTQERPFKALDGFVETHDVDVDDLRRGGIYTSGNWPGVYKFLKKHSNKDNPKIVYVGDHLIQDVYTPSQHTQCDAVAVCEELEAEGAFGHAQSHHDDRFLLSKIWGSYFYHGEEETIWTDFIRKHAKLAVPSLEFVAKHPIDHKFLYPHQF